MRLADVYRNPELLARARKGACGTTGQSLGPPVMLRPLSEKYPQVQTRNTGPASHARGQQTEGVGEEGVENERLA